MKTVFIPCHSVCSVVNGRLPENSPAQRDSGISKLGMGLMGVIGVMGLMGEKSEKQNRSTQRDSKMSILKNRPLGPYCPLVFKTRPAQRGSGISILGVLGILRSLRILGWKTKNENSPAQRDSIMSNLVFHLCNLRHLWIKNGPAQQDSEISILGWEEHCHTESAENTKSGIFTMLIKNIETVLWADGGMGQ